MDRFFIIIKTHQRNIYYALSFPIASIRQSSSAGKSRQPTDMYDNVENSRWRTHSGTTLSNKEHCIVQYKVE